MTSFILAMDQGTTSSRALLFDADARLVGIERQEFAQLYPEPGHVEHNPEDIWYSQLTSAARLIQSAGISPTDITSIGITNQRETTILWDRTTGSPVANAIVWQDRRTAPLCSELSRSGVAPRVRGLTGLTLDPYFSATKIRWLLDNVSGLRRRAEAGEIAFGTVDSFLLWRLTAGRLHATDATNASRTLLYNIHTCDWDEELLHLFNIPREILPEIQPSRHLYGSTAASVLGAEIPIGGIAGDQHAALFGQACLQPGMVKNTYGTGSFLLMNTGSAVKVSEHGLVSTLAWDLGAGPTYALEGSVFVTGAAVQWLRDEMQIIRNSAEIEPLAASVQNCGGVYFVPAFVGLGAPYWDPDARGAIIGITRGTSRAHIARAALEAACFQTADVLDAMESDAGVVVPELRVDGGMTVNNTLLQMQADILGVPVIRPAITETTALGAAYLAGLTAGVWSGTEEIRANWRIDAVFEPRISADQRQAMRACWKAAVGRVRGG